MRKFHKTLRVSAAAVLATLALASCAGDAGGGDSNGGGEVVFVDAVGTNPPHLNGELTTDITTGSVASAVFDKLIRIDGEFNLHPQLATSWQSNEDATQFTFELQEGVTWHDGEPFTSADVRFNLEEAFILHPLGGLIIPLISDIETPDDHTVIVNLSEPFAPFAHAIAGHFVLPAHIYQGTDIVTNQANMEPTGTGPFKFEEFIAGDRITVVRNDDYWRDMGDIDKVIFKIMPDTNARVLALQTGEVDRIIASFLDTAQVPTLKKDDNYFFSSDGAPGVMTLLFNTRDEILSDPAVRRALYTALDREAMVKNVFAGAGNPARGVIPDDIAWAVNPDFSYNEEFAYDPDAAGKMLDEAGYPIGADGTRFSLDLNYAAGIPTFGGSAELVKSDLEEIGVRVNLIQAELAIMSEQTWTRHDFDMSVIGLSVYEDPNLGIARNYVCNEENKMYVNPTGACIEEMDALWQKAGSTADQEKRAEYLKEAELLAAELLYTAPLVSYKGESVIRGDRWSGVEDHFNVIHYDWAALSSK